LQPPLLLPRLYQKPIHVVRYRKIPVASCQCMRLKLARWDIDTGTVIRTVELALQKTVRGCHIKHDNIYSPHV